MTNKEQFRLFLKNILLYSAIIVGGYYLYNYNNKDTHNIPHTDFSFVYAQF
jgi:hypothetical protein